MADETIEQRFAVTLAKTGVTASSHLGLAVSGGVDSIVLAHLALSFAQETGVRLSAFTVDHRLRDTSAAEAADTAALLRGWGIPCDILPWQDAAAGPGLQARARDARYALLSAAARAAGCDAVLLGHQADDQLETFFMRLCDGSGLKGLGGMREMRCDSGLLWLRPLLGVSRGDIAHYAARHDLPVIDDPSNAQDRFTRVRLRGLLQGLQDEGLSAERLARSIGKLQEAEDALDWATRQQWQARAQSFQGALSLDLANWQDLPRDLRRRLLQRALRCLSPAAYPPLHEQLSFLADQAGADDFAGHALAGCLLRAKAGRLWVMREPAALPPPGAIAADALCWDARFDMSGLAPWAGAGAQLAALGEGTVDKKLWAKDWQQAPALLRRGLPALWDGEKLLAVPSLSWRAGENLPVLPQVSPRNWGPDIV